MDLDFIILAGGRGERMKGYMDKHKTLLQVDGISLLANHLLNGSNYLGDRLREVYVVIGHRKEEVEEEIEKIRKELNFKVKTVEGDRMGTKYGRSLFNALEVSTSNFVAYVMGDHWIDYEDLSTEFPISRVEKIVRDYDLLLFSDPCPLIANPSSQFLLYYNKKRKEVLRSGESIREYSHVDMGFFIGNRMRLIKIIKKYNLLEKDFDTSDFIRCLGKRFGIVEIRNVKWFGCNTPADHLLAISLLKRLREK